MTQRPITVMVADDSRDIAALLEMLINSEPGMCCVARLESSDRLAQMIETLRPSVVIVDLAMPGPSSLAVLEAAARLHPDVRFIVFSGYDDPATVSDVFDRGAWGFLSKHFGLDRVVAAVRTVADGQLYGIPVAR